MMMYVYWGIFILLMIAGWIVSSQLRSRFKKYSKIPMNYGVTGKDVAEKMLHDNGIYDVQVECVKGHLSDHYNPKNKTVNLSEAVYHGNGVASGAVAAHECGHAVQHATAYSWLQMRSTLVPVVSFASNTVQWVLLGGILLINVFPQLMLAGIILFGLTTLFSIITLPVEVNASQRALVWLSKNNITSPETGHYAQDALRWAAYTYFIGALASLATLAYYVLLYLGRRN